MEVECPVLRKCVVASDAFKGTLSSLEICQIARTSIPRFFPDCQVMAVPVADGGEGTVDCFLGAWPGAVPVEVPVSGPWGEPLQAVYARNGEKAVIELAAAAGLPLAGARLDPERTSTYGVGQLLRHAVERGCTEILLGIGGSATNDGGCGCAAALGVRFLDEHGASFVPTGGTLQKIRRIDLSEARRLLSGVRLTVMCDVDAPLYGPSGAAAVFGPQKGADTAMVRRLDDGLCHLGGLLREGPSLAQRPGAGAAGGMGWGSAALLGATLRPGIDAVLDMVGFDRLLNGADLVITGEGHLDAQSVHGKVISGVARRTARKNIPLLVLAGGVDAEADAVYALGVTAVFGIDREATGFPACAERAAALYQSTLEDVLRLLRALGCGPH